MGLSTCHVLCIISLLSSVTTTAAAAAAFQCNTTSTTTCRALIDYVSPNTTTISAIQTLFGAKNLRQILGANNLSVNTPNNYTVAALQRIKIPFPCLCRNGTGVSNKRPVYTVVNGDGLDHIATDVFSRLVTFQQIQAVNNILNPNLIEVGQKLWIPLPCSCDSVDGQQVVHYGHVVEVGSTIEGFAQQYNVSAQTLLSLNGLNSSNELQASQVLDIPLRVCTSQISNSSLDYPLLVPNDTYVFTATNCVQCQCNAAISWTLQCEPSGLNSSIWSSCPSLQCQGGNGLYIGNTTTSCSSTSCAYAGYVNQTILTLPSQESTCPAPDNKSGASDMGLQGWRWSFLYVVVPVFLHLFR